MDKITDMNNGYLLVYTRKSIENIYSSHLAYSIHLAYSNDGIHFQALNKNYGMVYASATIDNRNVINEKGLKMPYIFKCANGDYGIVAIRVNYDGSLDEESKGKILLWTSKDLIDFKEIGLLQLNNDSYVQEVVCNYDPTAEQYIVSWKDENGNYLKNLFTDLKDVNCISEAEPDIKSHYDIPQDLPEGAVAGNVIGIDGITGEKLLLKWSQLKNTEIRVPDLIKAASAEVVNAVEATAVYTDGSVTSKRVIWDTNGIDFSKAGKYRIEGVVTQEDYLFPLAVGYADPVIFNWENRYYYIATNDNTNAIGLYVREADKVADLFKEEIQEHIILDLDEVKGFIQTFWAPEFHIIGGELYILFAVGAQIWAPQSYMMKLKKGGRITEADSWETPVRVLKADGSYLATEGITLDMTYVNTEKASYLVWSYREWAPEDSGSMLYIATINPEKPWQLASEPVLLSRPLFGWENNEHTINNEGPYAIVTEKEVFLTYSGGAAGGYTYALGVLTIPKDEDLLKPDNWKKRIAPVLSYYSIEDEYGPGHNSFYNDDAGNLMLVYHAQETMGNTSRCTAIHRVHVDINGNPRFDMPAEYDLDKSLRQVSMVVEVE